MADFFPGTEKSDSSQLNTDSRNAETRNTGTQNAKIQYSSQEPDKKETSPAAGTKDHDAVSKEVTNGRNFSAEKKEFSGRTGADSAAPASAAGNVDDDASGTGSSAEGRNSTSAKAATSGKAVPAGKPVSGEKSVSAGKPVSGEKSVSTGKPVSEDKSAPTDKSVSTDKTAESGKAVPTGKSVPVEKAMASAKPAPGDKPAPAGKAVPAETKKADSAKTASYREKILRHKKRRYRRTIILVILVMALLTTGVILWMRRGYRRAELIRIAALVADDSASYENLGGNVVQYGSSGAVCIDQRGNTLWDVSYEMQQPITSVSGNVIAIANRSGYYVYVMNTQGLMGTIHTTLPIHSIAAAENGEVAVIMDGTNATWVRLYTADGREIAYLVRTMAENGYPIAAAVSPDGETLCLSSVSMSNAAVKSNISFYNFGKTGQKMSDHLVEHADSVDVVVPYLHYMDNTTCICVSDKQLICYWRNIFRPSGSHYAELNDNILGVFCGDSFIGTLSTNTKGESQYTLDLYNKRGKKAGSVNFTMQYTNIAIGGDKIYIHNEQECQIYTIGGHCLFNGTFDKSIRALIPGAGLSDLLVVTAGEVDSVRLH